MRTALAQAAPRTLASWWGWQIEGHDYWARRRALPGEPIDYAGTGGMVADSAILRSRRLYLGLPTASWFLEDIGLGHVAVSAGYRMVALDAEIEFVMDETNQNHRLAPVKPDFYRVLAKRREAGKR